MAAIGISVLATIALVFVLKYLIKYFQHLRLNYLIANPGNNFNLRIIIFDVVGKCFHARIATFI